jgi:cell wall assembly regulator SMI1
MKATLKRLEQWAKAQELDLNEDFFPPAEVEDIEDLEKHLGLKLPPDYRALLEWHNGEDVITGMFADWQLLSTEGVMQEWEVWKGLSDDGIFDENHETVVCNGPVKQRWWHSAWIPITSDGNGNNHCLDLSPAQGGKAGQIITLFHESGERTVLAPSLKEWLDALAHALENNADVDDFLLKPIA